MVLVLVLVMGRGPTVAALEALLALVEGTASHQHAHSLVGHGGELEYKVEGTAVLWGAEKATADCNLPSRIQGGHAQRRYNGAPVKVVKAR